MQLTKYSSTKYSKDSKKINDRLGALSETVNRDAERDDVTGRTPRSGRVGSKYRHEKIVATTLRKRCEDLKLLRCLIQRHEKHRSFLFSRLDLLNRTDPGEAVRNVEYML